MHYVSHSFNPVQERAYRKEANLGSLPRMQKNTKMSKDLVASEVERVVKLIEAKSTYNEQQAKRKWDEAKKRAVLKKKNALKTQDLEKAKAAEKSGSGQSDTDKETASVSGQKEVADAATALSRDDAASMEGVFDEMEKVSQPTGRKDPPISDEVQDQVPHKTRKDVDADAATDDGAGNLEVASESTSKSASSGSEVYVPQSTKSRSEKASGIVELPKVPRTKRAYLPDNAIESRFGVILDNTKEIKTSLAAIEHEVDTIKTVRFKNSS